MPGENIEAVQRAIEAFNARDLDSYFACFHSDVVYRSRADEPDAGIRDGLDALKRYTAAWTDAFDDLRFEVRDWIDLGDRVITVAELQGRGSATGAPVHAPYVFLWTLRAGLIAEGSEYGTVEEALAAAGRQ